MTDGSNYVYFTQCFVIELIPLIYKVFGIENENDFEQ